MTGIYLNKEILNKLLEDAKLKYPNETGGVLMGYFNKNVNVFVITHIIGSGPNARHNKSSFEPDYKFQETEIEKIYSNSNRIYTYLGDWHTHPNGGPYLSSKDRKALKSISKYKKARINSPIMLLAAGTPHSWNVKIWQLKNGGWKSFIFPEKLIELKKNIY